MSRGHITLPTTKWTKQSNRNEVNTTNRNSCWTTKLAETDVFAVLKIHLQRSTYCLMTSPFISVCLMIHTVIVLVTGWRLNLTSHRPQSWEHEPQNIWRKILCTLTFKSPFVKPTECKPSHRKAQKKNTKNVIRDVCTVIFLVNIIPASA